ncbi:MAG: BMP family ABC transporter substrate-binding protein [Clostridia bacterium]|nr:BMP family ABC transporter substrate-binding protein [Clostridia bacterium]
MKKILALVLALAMVLAMGVMMASCGSSTSDDEDVIKSPLPEIELVKDFDVKDDFKIGIITLHDEKSTYDLNFIESVKRAAKAAGLKDEQVIIKSNIDESSACEEAALDLVDKGCKLIFADSFGHESFLMEAAKKHPEVQFCHATGTHAHTSGLSNFHNAFASIYEGRYVAGVAAGMKLKEMIDAGTITADKAVVGYVGAFTYAEVISGYTSFYLGVKSIVPTATMKVQFTGSWYDETAEKNAAQALMSMGCVLISQHADSLGAPSACEDAGVPNVSYNGSTIEAGPNTFIISSKIDWAPYFLYIMKCVNTGAAIDTDWTGNMSTGSVCLSEINAKVAAAGTAEKLADVISALKAGTLHVFDTATFTVGGEHLSSYLADVDDFGDYTPETEVITNGYFDESATGKRSAPYFDLRIDGIELVNEKY